AAAAEAVGLPFRREAFLDRGYRADGTLVPRGRPGDLLHDPVAAADRAVALVREGRVAAADGTWVDVDAASLCLHGDTDASLQMARAVRESLDDAGIEVRA